MANFSTKLASTVSAAAIVASATGASLVSAASEFLPYAEALVNKKVINAQSTEAGYRLNDQITRAELAKVAANLGGYTAVECTGKVFTDVNSSLGDLCTAIETLAAAKVISTANSTFRPSANVTRAEMTKMILGALGKTPSTTKGIFSDVTSTLGDLEGFINAAAEGGIVNKGTNFYPNNTGSRGEVFKIAARAAGLSVEAATKPEANNTIAAGNLTITTTAQPVAQEVPQNVASQKVATVKVAATGGDVVLSSITINRSGLGTVNGMSASVAYNGIEVSNATTFNSSTQNATLGLTNPITIKSGTSIDLDVLVSLSDAENALNENGRHTFSLVAANATNLATPVTLGLFASTTYKVGVMSVTELKGFSAIKSGQTGAKILELSLASAPNRETIVKGFTLTRKSGPDLTKSLTNVKVLVDGKDTGATATVTADKIVVNGLSTELAYSQSAKYQIVADVIYMEADYAKDGNLAEYTFAVVNSTDVRGTEKSTGYNVRVSQNSSNAVVKIQGVDVKITPEKVTTKSFIAGEEVTLIDGTITSPVSFNLKAYELYPKIVMNGATTVPELKKVFEWLTLTVDGNPYEIVQRPYNTSTSGIAAYNTGLLSNTAVRFDTNSAATGTTGQNGYDYAKTVGTHTGSLYTVSANVPFKITLKGKIKEMPDSGLAVTHANHPDNNVVDKVTEIQSVFRTLSITPTNSTTEIPFARNVYGDIFKQNTQSHTFKSVKVAEKLTSGLNQEFARYNFNVAGTRAITMTGVTVKPKSGFTGFEQIASDFTGGANGTLSQNTANALTVKVNGKEVKDLTNVIARVTAANDGTIEFVFATPVTLNPGNNVVSLELDAETNRTNAPTGDIDVTTTLLGLQYEGTTTVVNKVNNTAITGTIAADSAKISLNPVAKPGINVTPTGTVKFDDWKGLSPLEFVIKNNDANKAITPTKVTVSVSSAEKFDLGKVCLSNSADSSCVTADNVVVENNTTGDKKTYTMTFTLPADLAVEVAANSDSDSIFLILDTKSNLKNNPSTTFSVERVTYKTEGSNTEHNLTVDKSVTIEK